MEPDVIRMYSSSPPPMEDEDEDDEFGDFGGFSGVPNSVSFTEFDTPAAAFNQNQALNATSPPELLNNGGVVGVSNLSSGPSGRALADDPPRPNGVVPAGDGRPPDRTAGSDEPRKHADRSRPRRRSNSPAPSGSVQTRGEPADCNGGGEVLTNGFATFEVRETSPSSPQNSVRSRQTGASAERTPDDDDGGGDNFADFAAFSNADWGGDSDDSEGGDRPADEEGGACRQRPNTEQGSDSEDDVRDAADGLSNGDEGVAADDGSAASEIRDTHEHSAAEAACTKGPAGQNGTDSEGSEEGGGGAGDGVSPNAGADEKGSGDTETETETETSLGRPLSTDALEEYGDASTTGSPPLQEETATPADHSQLAEEEDDDDDGDFGDFGDAGSFGGQGFADFEQPETLERGGSTGAAQEMADDEEFGDFDAPPRSRGGGAAEDEDGEEGFADFPASDSFADFSSAAEAGGADAGWNAFDEPGQGQAGADSWAAFGEEPSATAPEGGEDEWRGGGGTAPAPPPPAGDDADRRDSLSASLSGRLEKLFQAAFPETPAPQLGEQVLSLKTLLEPPDKEDGEAGSPDDGGLRDVWRQLQDIHDAFGLRHQWGGSHSNKTLLRSLGIDTRNILYTGQKKQPVIVPMYAASLGMLEPTKEPVKPISAAEMITSIAQAPPVALEVTCPPDTAQETLPPVQFDWSSSGLTNPLDGVDPELFELTTAKLDPSGPGNRVADAFARLMSTMEKTSTSTTRKPRKEENLSEEASEVIAGLPDLSFMQAKVLMFPATLTPLGCTDPTPD